MPYVFSILSAINSFYWEYIGFSLIIFVGIYLTIKTKGYQFRALIKTRKYFVELYKDTQKNDPGTHPIKLYFASVGGMIGLGNIVSVIAAVTIGGPGGIFWLWVASFVGMLIKYSEIFLGMTYRVPHGKHGYDGGPMYYLEAAFKGKFLSITVCILLCIYGAEVSQFVILTDTLSNGLKIDRFLVIGCLLVFFIYSALGGVNRLANICSAMMPPFLILYVSMCGWVIFQNFDELVRMMPIIFHSAFFGHAAVGGFVGSTIFFAAQYGLSRAVYSGDIGIGYDSIIQSESRAKTPQKQARVAIFALFSDTFICTLSCLVVLVTGLWKTTDKLQPSEYIPRALGEYFPFIDQFMIILFFIAASSTIIGYLVVGLKCAKYLNKKIGEKIYIAYAASSFIFFSFTDQATVIMVMSLSAGLLMMCNLMGILKLRNKIKYC